MFCTTKKNIISVIKNALIPCYLSVKKYSFQRKIVPLYYNRKLTTIRTSEQENSFFRSVFCCHGCFARMFFQQKTGFPSCFFWYLPFVCNINVVSYHTVCFFLRKKKGTDAKSSAINNRFKNDSFFENKSIRRLLNIEIMFAKNEGDAVGEECGRADARVPRFLASRY